MTQPTTATGSGPCSICASYAHHRGDRIRAEIRRTTPAGQRLDRWARFMAGVHQRHLNPGRPAWRPARPTSKETR